MRSQAELDAVIAGLREAHRELRVPLTNRGIVRVLSRERITRDPMRLPVPAMTVIQYGHAAIMIDPDRVRNPRVETEVLAEEYAHAKLHAGDPGEVVVHLYVAHSDDPREYEADYLARALLAGPECPVEYRTPARSRRPTRRATRVVVPPAFEPYSHPVETTPGRLTPRYGGRDGETPLQRAMRLARPLRREMPSGPASDHGIVTHSPGRVRYVDREGRAWTVWDVVVRGEKRAVVTGGAGDARARYFVSAAGARRVYLFDSKRELRDVAERHLERQLRDAADARGVTEERKVVGGLP